MDMGETYGFTGRDGKRYEFSTYPAWDNDWAEGRLEINGEVARSSHRRGIAARHRPRRRRHRYSRTHRRRGDRGEESDAGATGSWSTPRRWELEEMLEQRREVA